LKSVNLSKVTVDNVGVPFFETQYSSVLHSFSIISGYITTVLGH